jgi:Flp pilus assembly protein TadG
MHEEVVVGDRRGPWDPATTPAVSGRQLDQSGAVTAEAAMVLPLLVAFALGMVWLFAVAVAQVRVVDGARETARAAARGESDDAAVARGRQVAPAGSRFVVSRGGHQVEVTVSAEVHGPGGLFARVPGLVLTSRAVAAQEPQ